MILFHDYSNFNIIYSTNKQIRSFFLNRKLIQIFIWFSKFEFEFEFHWA